MTTAAQRNPAPPAPPAARDYNEIPLGTFADEIDEDRVLQQAAEILAKRSAPIPEPDPIPSKSIKPGESLLIHVLDAFSLDGFRKSHLRRGAEVIITHEQVSGPDWSDHQAGVNKFDAMLAEGRQVAPGPWPSHLTVWTYGDDAWKDARRAAMARAADEHDPQDRQRAGAAVVAKYGPAAFTPANAAAYYATLYSGTEAHEHARKCLERDR